jgi:hypothetical protein
MIFSRSMRRSGSTRDPIEFGWQVHAVQEASTARADVKASVLLAFQAGAFVFGVSVRDLLLPLDRIRLAVAVGAVGMLLLAILASALTVLPRLGSSWRHRREYPRHIVYFGHLRLWRPPELAAKLTRVTVREQADMLALQIIALSRLNWRKHRLLQLSVGLTLLSILTMSVVAAAPYLGWRG